MKNLLNRIGILLLVCLLCLGLAACGSSEAGTETGADSAQASLQDAAVQLSTITHLVAGDYYGSLTVEELLSYGDFGLGTFDGVNGEMIVVDGVCYQALGDGSVVTADSTETVPFATVCRFEEDFTVDLDNIGSMEALASALTQAVEVNGANSVYFAKIQGTFPMMHVRSETKQQEPYVALDQALAVSQKEYTYTETTGTLVCLYFPEYMSQLNSAGWHFHYISDDRSQGGHVLDLSFDYAVAQINECSNFSMIFPDTESFQDIDYNAVGQENIDAAERQSNTEN